MGALLDEAVRAFLEEHPSEQVTVIVDATFGHRIHESEQEAFEQAVDAGELLTAPAGTIGRGDAFILEVAEKADATVLSTTRCAMTAEVVTFPTPSVATARKE